MLYEGCCGVVDKDGKGEFFALSFFDYRVYLRSVSAGVDTIAEELDDFMGCSECRLINATDDEFTGSVLKSLADFQTKNKTENK